MIEQSNHGILQSVKDGWLKKVTDAKGDEVNSEVIFEYDVLEEGIRLLKVVPKDIVLQVYKQVKEVAKVAYSFATKPEFCNDVVNVVESILTKIYEEIKTASS